TDWFFAVMKKAVYHKSSSAHIHRNDLRPRGLFLAGQPPGDGLRQVGRPTLVDDPPKLPPHLVSPSRAYQFVPDVMSRALPVVTDHVIKRLRRAAPRAEHRVVGQREIVARLVPPILLDGPQDRTDHRHAQKSGPHFSGGFGAGLN